MAEFLLILYLLYLVGLGQAWLGLFIRPPRWRWAQLPWSFGLGTILWAYAQFLLNVLNLPSRGMWLYGWQMALVAAPISLRFVIPRSPWRSRSAIHNIDGTTVALGDDSYTGGVPWVKPMIFLLIVMALLTAVLQALAFPMHLWDSIVIYGFKAKILFKEQTFKTDAFLDPSVLHYSADYPLLLSYLEAGFYRWLGYPDDRVVRLLFVAYWASWLGLMYEALTDRIRKDFAWMLVGVIATLPLFSNIFMGQAASGFADIPFGFYWTAFLICGTRIIRKELKAPWIVMALFAVGCSFTKNEGLPAIVIGYGLFILCDRSQNRRSWIGSFGVGALLLLPWWWVRHLLPHNAAHYARILSLSPNLILQRLKWIGVYAAQEIFQIRSWGLFWPLVFFGLFRPARQSPFSKESKILIAAVGLQLAVYGYVYLTFQQDLELLIPITLLRLLVQTIGPLTLALGWRLQGEEGGVKT